MVHVSLRNFCSITPKFRDSFKLPNNNVLRWFPGHMNRGLKDMENKLRSVDCIIEVHDARIPLSGRNPQFKNTVCGIKPHILILNKTDLIDNKKLPVIEKVVKKEGGANDVIFTNCRDEKCKGVQKVLPTVMQLIRNSTRYNRAEVKEFSLMVIGVPNVGKSTFLNHIRKSNIKKGGGAKTGAKAGITRSVSNRIKVSTDPLVYVFDTPGIWTPYIPDIETGMKLALCETTQDHLVQFLNMADYLLYWFNKNKQFRYLQTFDLEEPSDDIRLVLTKLAITCKFYSKRKSIEDGKYRMVPNLDMAASHFVTSFRKGELGKIILDSDKLFPNETKPEVTIDSSFSHVVN
nr:PREDICTED: mitochondrial GTPase 1 [Bemisia tabaci]